MIYRFAQFELHTHTESLHAGGTSIPLRPKAWELLLYLVTHRDRIVTKQELSEQLWPEQFVSDSTVESTVAAVRRALRDSGQAQGLIQTLQRRGYRFIAAVEVEDPDTSPPGPEVPSSIDPPPPTLVDPHHEPKLITALCGTISPPLTQLAAGDLERQHGLMSAWGSQVQAAIFPYGGTLHHLERDRFVVLFGTPQAQEDHAQRALLSALAVQHQWQEYLRTPVPSPDLSPTLGLGLHTGWVVVARPREASSRLTLIVDEISWVAAHLSQRAESGTPLASAAVVQHVPNPLDFERLEPLMLPGQSDPVVVYGCRATESPQERLTLRWVRHQSAFVGWQVEMAALHTGLSRAQQGQGVVVGVAGDAGMGKTRLVETFGQEMADEAVRVVMGRCVSYGQVTPYFPLQSLVRQLCEIEAEDDPSVRRAQLTTHLHRLDLDPCEELPFLLDVLGDPVGMQQLQGGVTQGAPVADLRGATSTGAAEQ